MSDDYRLLLDSTIQHLNDLKSRGARFLSISGETLQALQAPAPRPRAAPAPTSVPSVMQEPRPSPQSRLTIVSTKPAQTAASDDKSSRFEELRGRVLGCTKCPHLVVSRKSVVFGVGDLNAQLMFVGEAPGADEDRLGEPFVGKAGQLLTKIIETMGLSRESVYIANILKCRPDTPGEAYGNRKPTPVEMQTCVGYLQEQIDLIRPKVLVALGGTAVQGLLGKPESITRLRGNWRTYRDIPLMPTYHPAYLLHQDRPTSEKRRLWEDMLQVMEKLGMPITEKQRRYFLAG